MFQYKAGAAYMSSLKAPISIVDMARKRKHGLLDIDLYKPSLLFGHCEHTCEVFADQEGINVDPEYVELQPDEEVPYGDDHDVDSRVDDISVEESIFDELNDPELPLKFRQSATMYKEMKNRVPSQERKDKVGSRVKKCGEDLSTNQIALIDLAEILSRHKCDKGLFDDIVKWARHWSNIKQDIWSSNGTSNEWSRKTILKALAQEFDAGDLKPCVKTVRLSDKRVVSVPVIDFEATVRSLLDDEEINNQRNLMKGIDPNTST